MAAPLQGFTEAPFRHFHARIYSGAAVRYFSPFLRMEKGEVRRRDLRDITSPLDDGSYTLIPQVIARDAAEFRALTDVVAGCGYTSVDLNAGCPFPPQVRKGRGAGLISGDGTALAGIASAMREYPSVSFSLKMRLGTESAGQWRALMPVINDMPLTHVTLHPRTAVQQYSGTLYYDEVEPFASGLRHPLVLNGDISSADDIVALRARYPFLSGVMLGRGLLRSPSVFAEYTSGEAWDEGKRCAYMLRLHRAVLDYYSSVLCGGHQVLAKILPLWEYFSDSFPRKIVKPLVKSRTLDSFMSALLALEREYAFENIR